MQNISKRDKKAKRITRSGLVPSPGCVIGEGDFSGAEVCLSAAYHKDKNFIKYLLDPSTDMHRDCYSFDTRILTENGFKYYDDISKDEKIAQYDASIDKISYVTPEDRICYEYSGDMYYIRNGYIDVCVTPNHRLYLSKRNNKDFKIVHAKDVVHASYYSKTGADIAETCIPHTFHFEPVYGTGVNSTKKYHEAFTIKADDMFELLGYLVTDGHFKYHTQGAYRINLSQMKESRLKIKTCIDRIKSYTDFKFHEEETKWSMSNKSFCSWLCNNFGVNKINRKIPTFIKYAPKEQLQLFFDACMLGDGRFNKSGKSGTLFTVSPEFIDDFQFVCMRLGYSSKVSKIPLKGNRTIQVYNIHFMQYSEYHVKTYPPFFGKESYNGKVFCFTVPSGLLVTQRNNKISIQGNCAKDLWLLKTLWDEMDPGIAKGIRQNTKADWTFAEFYGARWKKCAVAMWEKRGMVIFPNSGKTLEDHLHKMGIHSEEEFFKHVEAFEKKFWGEMFPEYAKWKQKVVLDYIKNGYVETYLGFQFKGVMNEREVCNYPIQGTSFHMLLYVAYELQKQLRKKGMKTKLIGQIHDSIIADIPKEEVVEYTKMLKAIMGTLQDTFPWLETPIKIEFEISRLREEGGAFAELHQVDVDKIEQIQEYEDLIFVSYTDKQGVAHRNTTRPLEVIN